jgi:Winged helix DNA-binding domain
MPTKKKAVSGLPVLSQRALNRALLSRQMLLERQNISVAQAVQNLVGLQAQVSNPPYIGLWTRLKDFTHPTLTGAMQEKHIVRAALMRSTLHLFTTEDYLSFRITIQPALVKGLRSFFSQWAGTISLEMLLPIAREALSTQALSTGQQKEIFIAALPNQNGDAMAYAVRAYLPTVQIPPGGTWGSGTSASYMLAEAWLGQTVAPQENIGGLFHRYLSAFGPASLADFQAWLGIPKLKDAVAPFLEGLRQFQDVRGTVLWDVTDGPLPAEDTPAPIRLIPEYDNLIISHDERTRIIADANYKKVFLSAARVRATFLVDGFVAGAWKITHAKKVVTLTFEPFQPLSQADQQALTAEGEQLLRFVEENAATYIVEFQD